VRLFQDIPAPGTLITIDGPNGAGKTSLASAVATWLRRADARVHTTKQPSPTWLGDAVRHAEGSVRGRALACLVAGDRHHQIDTEILPRLAEGEIVICDRYLESSLVLQRLDGVDVDFILGLNSGLPRPSLRIRLLADPAVLDARLRERPVDPGRRFERTATRAEELALYEEADRLISEQEDLPAVVYDTTASDAEALGREVAGLVITLR
jgi:dTMP kinase